MACSRLQALDVTTLRAVLAEWRSLLLPSRFEKAQQASPHALQIGLRSLSGIHWLELSWQADAARLHTIPPPPRQGDGSTLAQQLQHGLRGLALVEIRQQGWERVVELGFARRPGDPVQRWLVAELMGRFSNLLLLDGDRQVVALARQVKPQQSRLRPIGTGDPYQPPPPLAGEPPRLEEGFESWQRRLKLLPVPLAQALRGAYQGISPALLRQLLPTGWGERPVDTLSPPEWQQLWQAWRGWLEAVESERFDWKLEPEGFRCWWAPKAGAIEPTVTVNQGLAAYIDEHLTAQVLLQRRQQLGRRLEAAAEREHRQAAEQQALLAAVPESEALQRRADALLSQRQPGRACIEEAQKLYKTARKRRRSVAAITPRLELHQQRLTWLEASLTYLEQADSLEQVEQLAGELEALLAERSRGSQGGGVQTGNRQARRSPATEGVPQPLELHTASGLPLHVGRNHRQNEWIAFRQARRGDLWFHAQELPGSHVVLKSSQQEASEGDLQAAADLAAHFSRGRGNRRVPVVMVPTEELQRIPGAAPGTVRHRGGTVLWGEPQRALSLLPEQRP
ncbi:NFACT family protein [Cyanobium sp. ATX 6E8]|uniref:Rqc2 family fibronectin-binding protein n=1 Tax=Cyanobium sp. ATX 6E8 TaxID=2823701 RepID=UPI0020CCADC7|nr:NFACT RNA binding domain-containing protein [Cyanobium sp. ATX 6E8]MCP9941579.1 NFACT family protein [Cyanobium sp. ATX 6E8]